MNGMSVIVRKVTQLISGLIFLYGVYIVTHGHLSPGGGFAGGAIIAGSFILVILAFGSEKMKLRKEEVGSTVTESLAVLAIVILAISGLLTGSKIFFQNYLPTGTPGELFSAGLIPLYNILTGIEVAAAILTVFLGLIIFKEEETQ
jgi:multisubunit Na+/H+ antiporter MnhB subunit